MTESRRVRHVVMVAVVVAAVLAAEAYSILADRADTFSIEGKRVYEIPEFASGGVVSHAFLMQGDGLHSVRIRLSSQTATDATLQWTLWRGFYDAPQDMSKSFEGVEALKLRGGAEWKTLEFPRDGSSHNRWYTLDIRLANPNPLPSPQVFVVASHDNPDRGGVLWVNTVRQPGSLFLRADRRGRTLYREFRASVAPNLPAPLRIPAVQLTLAAAFHWALFMFAYAYLTETSFRNGRSHRS
jgi:hypothetical protein